MHLGRTDIDKGTKLKNSLWTKRAGIVIIAVVLMACGANDDRKHLANARAAAAKGETKAAMVSIKMVLQNDPQLGEARLLLGQVLLQTGDAAAAEVELKKARELKQPDDLVLPALARAMLAQGKAKAVVGDFSALRLGDGDSEASLKTIVASAYLELDDLARSKTLVDEVLRTYPRFVPALLVKARSQATVRQYSEALATIDIAIGADERSHEAWKLRGDLQVVNDGLSNDALTSFRKAYGLHPDFLAARIAAVVILMQRRELLVARQEFTALRRALPPSGAITFLEAQLVFNEGNFTQARELIQGLLRIAPDDARLLQFAGATELQLGLLTQAESHLMRALAAQANRNSILSRKLLARTVLRMGQPSRALTILRPLIEREPVDAAVLVTAAEAYLQIGDNPKAEAYFKRAASAAPGNVNIRTALVLVGMANDKSNVEAGLQELQTLSAADQGSYADMALISGKLKQGNLDGALKAIAVLERKLPDDPVAKNLRGRVLLMRKDVVGARASFQAALAMQPSYYAAAANLAAIDMQEQKLADAAKRFEAVIKADPRNVPAYLDLAALRVRMGAPRPAVADTLLVAVRAADAEPALRVALVNHYLAGREFKAALLAAQDGVARLPDDAEMVDALARAQNASGELNQAILSYTKLSKIEPKSPFPYLRLGDSYFAAKDLEQATKSYRRALELVPGQIEAQRGLIGISLKQGRTDSAIAVARELQRMGPDDPTGYLFEADIYAETKKFDQAATVYRTALKKLKTSNQIAIRLHATLRASGKRAEAAEFSAAWLKSLPRDADFRYYMGDFYMAQRDYSAAEIKYKEVLVLQPQNPWAMNNLAWLMAKMGKSGASEYATRALALAPDKPALLDTLAITLEAEGNLPKAIATEEQALKIDSNLHDLRLNLARLYIKSRNKDQALSELQKLSALGAKYPRQSEVAELVKFSSQMK